MVQSTWVCMFLNQFLYEFDKQILYYISRKYTVSTMEVNVGDEIKKNGTKIHSINKPCENKRKPSYNVIRSRQIHE